MKKLMLLFVSALVLVSCDTDDGPSVGYAVAEITDADLPDYFEAGETYKFDVSYQLPNACHDFYTFQTNQYKSEDKDSTLVIEIGTLTTYDPNLTECTEEGDLNESKKISGLEINSKLYNNYHFRLLTGGDEDNNAQYLDIEVPVGKPEPETPEEATNE